MIILWAKREVGVWKVLVRYISARQTVQMLCLPQATLQVLASYPMKERHAYHLEQPLREYLAQPSLSHF